MAYDFDRVIDRHHTNSLKFDCAEERGKPPDLTPLWVADMDFALPDEVLGELHERVSQGIFGYSEPDEAYFETLGTWTQEHYGWRAAREWVTVTPGIVYALACCVRAFTRPGDRVLITQPVYYPFSEVIEDNGRVVANCSLSYHNGRYDLDFAAFEKAIEASAARLFLLCNPHNPGGRVWTADELAHMDEICRRHDVIVVSDEIHADFNRPGYEHVSYLTLDRHKVSPAVVCTSPSKTFNIAGLQVSNIVIPDEGLREAFRRENAAAGYSQANVMGLVACEACYRLGGQWLRELKDYLEGNLSLIAATLASKAPELALMEQGSTYLAWIDCRALGLTDDELRALVEDEAGLWLDMGDIFGPDGSGFIRINFACPRSVLEDAMSRLVGAVRNLWDSRKR